MQRTLTGIGIVSILVIFITATRIPSAPVPDRFVLGMNFAGISDWGTEPVWKDLFKQSRTWCPQRDGMEWGQGFPLAVDSLGWITKLDDGQTADVPLFGSTAEIWTSMDPDSTYICTWEGSGTVEFWNAADFKTVAPNRIEIRAKPESAPFLNLKTTGAADPVHNIRIFRRDHETTLAAEPWHDEFLDRWKDFKLIRFMDWQATNDNPVSEWSKRTRPSSQTQARESGVALEYMIDYCNRTMSDPWFCIPHLATDEYVRAFATMVRDRLNPQLTAYVEYSNEVWNSIFSQTKYCEDRGVALGLGTAQSPWEAGWAYSGRRSGVIFSIWEEIFGGTGRFVRVVASQMNTYVANKKLQQDSVFKKTDALAIAPYFGGGLSGDRLGEIENWTVDQVLDSCKADIEGGVRQGIQGFVDYLKELNAKEGTDIRLIGYEGGQHLSAWNQNAKVTDLFTQANRHARMYDLYLQYFEQWIELGGGPFANFSSVGSHGVYGAWGVLESVDQDPQTAPKYRALLELMRRHPVAARRLPPGGSSVARSLHMKVVSTSDAISFTADKPFSFLFTDLKGRPVASSRAENRLFAVSRSVLAPGIYILRCVADGHGTVVRVAVE